MDALVSLSGGMDSATVLGYTVAAYGSSNVQAVGFTYGSKHNPYEQACAKNLAMHYGVDYSQMDLEPLFGSFRSNLLRSGGDIPEGHYEDKSMALTVVPGRNTIFASMLMGLAQSLEIPVVYLGIHSGDHAIYPDCRPEWLHAMNQVATAATEGAVRFSAPFIDLDKEGILREGAQLGVPYQLTRTCYKDQVYSCGKCGSCTERLEAWQRIGTTDPIRYEGVTL